MENRRGNEIFLGVIGVATLVVAIIGATFAYFSASTNSTENAVRAESTTLSLNFVDNVGTKLSTNLIPATETIATYGAINSTYLASNEQCIDDNGNEICSVYEFTITNPSSTTTQIVTYTFKAILNDFTNLKYKIYEGAVSSGLDSTASTVIAADDVPAKDESKTLALDTELSPTESKTYTMIIWINEAGEQTTADAGKSFAAGLTITSGSGSGVTGMIAGAV